jgi:co-chaperonin GroES (HSP10)
VTPQLRPLDDRVFIEPLRPTSDLASGLVRPLANVISREGILLHEDGNDQYINQGVVFALGDGIRRRDGSTYHVVRLGDHVVFSPYACVHVRYDGSTPLLVVRERDIEAVVED